MTDFQYLIDNNVLTKLSRDQRASDFFRTKCHVPSEVLHEARGFPDIDSLSTREYPTTPGVLRQLVKVMETVPIDNTRLVDLYANEGNADPLIVACALDAQDANEGLLFWPTWVVVSDDGAVQAKATEFEISVRTSAEFKAIISE
ncbi:hypothetical protein [Antrihabitans spumae]|uniref:PIN domain-containing protein n=1 Tax=Antrihabitans spumae TaxID=3373370 RepID=A0ABW7KKT8_9NOCA